MYVKDFIKQVASGYLCKDDILSYAYNSYDKKELLWNLYLSDKEVEEDTGKPLITDDKGISRVDDAISFISKEFNVSLWDDSPNEPTAGDSTGKPTAGDSPSKQKTTAERGKKHIPFRECLQDDCDLEKLHAVMKGKKRKKAALVMKVAVRIGWITKPSFKAVKNEFGDIGSESGYNKIMAKNAFTDDEIKGMEEILKPTNDTKK